MSWRVSFIVDDDPVNSVDAGERHIEESIMDEGKALPSHVVTLIGDSDIERWPTDLLPSVLGSEVSVRGQSGATLADVLPLMKEELHATSSPRCLIVVFCAGENDIVQSIRLDETLTYFRRLLEMVFPPEEAPTSGRHLIVLGPKFEPWLEYDAACRKQYFKMSNAMERACKQYDTKAPNHTITYLDCLTMFCGESGQLPGAVLGGRAVPEKTLFDYDQLHLSREGYKIWKEVAEGHIASLLDVGNVHASSRVEAKKE
jgi:lysophospholipase L1-like esterase